MDEETFFRLSTKECLVPNDSYYVPEYIKDLELAMQLRAGNAAAAMETISRAVPVCYAHDGNFYFQRDYTVKKRPPPRPCLTPLAGYVRAALLCANPPGDTKNPKVAVLEHMLRCVPRPDVKGGKDEEYLKWMQVDLPDTSCSTGISCISDLTLLSLLRRIHWSNMEAKAKFVREHSDRYSALDSMEEPNQRQVYIDDMIRTHKYVALVKFVRSAPVIKKFYGEDPCTAFPYYTYGWFRCLAVLMDPTALRTAFSKDPTTFVDAAATQCFLSEYVNDRMKYPNLPFTPGTRGHYFVQWLLSADCLILVEEICPPQMLPELLKNGRKRQSPSDTDALKAMFSSWIRV